MHEQELIALIKVKDKRGLSELYDRYSAALYGVIIRIVKNEAIAEEILQDVFLKVWNKIDQYDEVRSRLYTWLHQIARNTAIDVYRLKSVQNNEATEKVEDTCKLEYKFTEEPKVKDVGLRTIINKLKSEYRDLIETLYFKGYSQSEAAELLGIPLGTVKTRSRHAIIELRKLIS